jgi:hypothetical protein
LTKKLPVWRIYEIRSKSRYIGSVMAADEKGAVTKAIEGFGIADPHRQRRLVARREG